MRVSAKVDYALRAMAELAAAPPGLTTAEQLASAQHIPPKFLESILAQLRSGGLVASQRGAEGGYQLARPAEEISIAEVIRELEGPIATVRGVRPDELAVRGRGRGAARRLARAAHADPRRPRADDARGPRHARADQFGLAAASLLMAIISTANTY